jgi:hypothetical protein
VKLRAILLAVGALGLAQETQPGKTQTGAIVGNVMSVGVTLEAVAGAPFAAESVSSTIRTLSDGTRIDQPVTSSSKYYRDGQGRTREEIIYIAPSGERTLSMVHIADPIEGLHYTLDPKNKIAHRVMLTVSKPTPGGPRAPIPVSGPNTTSEPLGLQIVNGVPAQGRLYTTRIPKGTVRNDRDFQETIEAWTSVELGWNVRQVTRSPLRGEITYEWINISRQEPDPNLFRIPSGYGVTDEKGPYFIGR